MKQREIKFRAWFKKEKKMFYQNPKMNNICKFNFKGDVQIMKRPAGVVTGVNDKTRYDFELMQYTGLKDKNSKEIYEGDILKCGQYILNPIIVYWDRGLCGWELKTEDEGNFEHLLDLSGEEDLGYIIWEIIGNIYENPELLEER